jgi:hypothetical protein
LNTKRREASCSVISAENSRYWRFSVMEYLNKVWAETMIAEVQKNEKLFSLPRFIGPTRFQLTLSEMQ